MQRFLAFLGVVVAIVAFSWFESQYDDSHSFDTMEYRGQPIKLSRQFADYEDYENDPDKFSPEEIPKVQELVKTAPISKHFKSSEQLTWAVFGLPFPGCGVGSFGEKPQPDGSVLELFSIEIPMSGTFRYLLFRGNEDDYTLVDDFVYRDEAGIMGVHGEGDRFIYTTLQGEKVIERTPSLE